MKKIILILIVFFSLQMYSQEKLENNEPIIFGEFLLGAASEINGNEGLLLGGALKYQLKSNLLTVRYLAFIQFESDLILLSPFIPIPIIREKINHKEIGILYGKRWIYEGSSLSFSGGISLNNYLNKMTNENNEIINIKNNYIGFPFEVNFKWFKSTKKRYRIFGIIPVGKPTSFGRNLGFKLVGNISKKSFVGLGLVYGFGVHKKY